MNIATDGSETARPFTLQFPTKVPRVLLQNYRYPGELRCGPNGPPAQVGDTVRLFLEGDGGGGGPSGYQLSGNTTPTVTTMIQIPELRNDHLQFSSDGQETPPVSGPWFWWKYSPGLWLVEYWLNGNVAGRWSGQIGEFETPTEANPYIAVEGVSGELTASHYDGSESSEIYVDAKIVAPIKTTKQLVAGCAKVFTLYNFEYLLESTGGSIPLVESDVISVECISCCESLESRFDSVEQAAISAQNSAEEAAESAQVAIDEVAIAVTDAQNAAQQSLQSALSAQDSLQQTQAASTSAQNSANTAAQIVNDFNNSNQFTVLQGEVEQVKDYGSFLELRNYCISQCLRANVMPPSGVLTTKWARPGLLYNNGQWIADGCYIAMGLASTGEASDAADAWQILRTFGSSQNPSTGFIPRYTRANGTVTDNGSTSQWPIIAHACAFVYARNPNNAAANEVYQIAKRHHQWWETKRQDASGLAFWGAEAFSNEANLRYLSMCEGAMDKFGFANDTSITLASTLVGVGSGHDFTCPVLNALLVMEAQAMSSLATSLGISGDSAIYNSKANTRKSLMNNIMWDEETGWYQRTLRLDKCISRTQVGAISGTQLTLTNTGGDFTVVLAGERLIFSNGATAQVARNPLREDGNWQIGQPAMADSTRTINLLGVPSGVTTGMSVLYRQFAYFKAFPDAALALEAGIPVPGDGRAERIISNCKKVFDGTEPDTTSHFFTFPSYRNNGVIKSGWTKWHTFFTGGTPAGTVINVSGSSTINSFYRDNGTDEYGLHVAIPLLRNYIFEERSKEAGRRTRPFTAKIFFQRTGVGEPNLVMRDYRTVLNDGQPLALSTPYSAPSGTGTPVTGTAEFTDNAVVGIYNYTFTGSCVVFGHSMTTYPVGYVLESEYGFLTSSRVGGYCYFRPADDPYATNQDDTYWQPGIWAHFQMHFYNGLLRYNRPAEARAHGEKFLRSWDAAYKRKGDIEEYLTPLGNSRGSAKYGWSGAALVIVLDNIMNA